jgi:superfamily I DNA/RNA helicase
MSEVRPRQPGRSDVEAELQQATDRIVQSTSRRKLVVAGPGAGKTTLFKRLLTETRGDNGSRLVLTFINNLKEGLAESLGDLATVQTLHGYCQSLLHRRPELRAGLTENFSCLPGLASLIKSDWEFIRGEPAPPFVGLMRDLADDDGIEFYLGRSDHYDAVDFDDSVYRTYVGLAAAPGAVQGYDLVLVDEYQDFNHMESGVIDILAQHNAIVVAGDDDQALYSQLRGASWEHIRSLSHGEDYEIFPLPFCMRCPEVIVGAVNDVIASARNAGKLGGRIDKQYRYFESLKGGDSRRYPLIDRVTTTVQRANSNYFGRYIEAAIRRIPQEEIAEAQGRGEPAVLIIGGRQYLGQIVDHLAACGLAVDTGRDREPSKVDRTAGLERLSRDPASNLGWRVILEFVDREIASSCVRRAAERAVPLVEVLPEGLRDSVLKEAAEFVADQEADEEPQEEEADRDAFIKATSFQGAKGLSAQHVFIVGLHADEFPRDTDDIQDLEICKFIVGLTRAKKKCALLLTRNFAGNWKQPSPFLSWIRADRFEDVRVDARYFAERTPARPRE